jgi:hypothetical protein
MNSLLVLMLFFLPGCPGCQTAAVRSEAGSQTGLSLLVLHVPHDSIPSIPSAGSAISPAAALTVAQVQHLKHSSLGSTGSESSTDADRFKDVPENERGIDQLGYSILFEHRAKILSLIQEGHYIVKFNGRDYTPVEFARLMQIKEAFVNWLEEQERALMDEYNRQLEEEKKAS